VRTVFKVMIPLGMLYAAYWGIDWVVDGPTVGSVAGTLLGIVWVVQGSLLLYAGHKKQAAIGREAEER